MAIPDPPKAGSPFSPLWTGGWNPKTPKINNFFIPEITLRGGYARHQPPVHQRPEKATGPARLAHPGFGLEHPGNGPKTGKSLNFTYLYLYPSAPRLSSRK